MAAEPLHAGDFNLTDLKMFGLRKIVMSEYKCPTGRYQRQCSQNNPGRIYDPVTVQRPTGLPVFPESVFSGRLRFQRLVPVLALWLLGSTRYTQAPSSVLCQPLQFVGNSLHQLVRAGMGD